MLLKSESPFLRNNLAVNAWLTKQLDAPGEAVDIYESPQRFWDMDPAEKQHGSGVIDAVKYPTLFVDPKGDDVSLTGELLWQGFSPESALRHQVRTGVFG